MSNKLQTGSDANDVLYLSKGNEVIDGLAGIDLLYAGSSYMDTELTFDSDKGNWVLNYGNNKPFEITENGQLELRNIETVVFYQNDERFEVSLDEQTKRWITDSNQSGNESDNILSIGNNNKSVDGKGGIDVLDVSVVYNHYMTYAASGLTFDSSSGYWTLNHFLADKNPVELIDIEAIKFRDIEVKLDDSRLKQPTQHVSTDDADNLIGNDLGYALSGGKGDDVLTGNGGDDALYGGIGKDVAAYRGSRSDYLVEQIDQYTYTVKDLNSNRDGIDTLRSVERLRFAAGEFDIDVLVNRIDGDLGSKIYGGFIDTALMGNGGDDFLYGGYGKDTAVYRGLHSDYLIKLDPTTYQYTVQDLNDNRDGTDSLQFIEQLRFADGEFDIAALAILEGSNADDTFSLWGSGFIDGKGGNDVVSTYSNYAYSGLTFDNTKGRWMVNDYNNKPVELIDIEVIQFYDLEVRLDDARLQQPTQNNYTDGNDNLVGNDLGYTLYGGNGDDVLTGNGGDDTLNGDGGINVAVYRGSRGDYVIERGISYVDFDFGYQYYDHSGYTVRDLNAERDGKDTLYNIQKLRFADGEFDIAAVATLRPSAELPPTSFDNGVVGGIARENTQGWIVESTFGDSMTSAVPMVQVELIGSSMSAILDTWSDFGL